MQTKEKKFSGADLIREKINENGYFIGDLANLCHNKKILMIISIVYAISCQLKIFK